MKVQELAKKMKFLFPVWIAKEFQSTFMVITYFTEIV